MRIFQVLIVFSFVMASNAQAIPETFRSLTDSLITAAPTNYYDLETTLSAYKKDTELMTYFIGESLKRNYQEGLVFGYNQKGIAYRIQSDYEKGITSFKNALKVAEKNGAVELELITLNLLAQAYLKKDLIKEALICSQKALEIADSISDPGLIIKKENGQAIRNLGMIYHLIQQYDLACVEYEKALSIDKAIEHEFGMASDHMLLGESLEAQEKLEAALLNYEAALGYNKSLGSDSIEVFSKLGIGHVLVHQGKADNSLELFQSILPMAIDMGDQEMISTININMGWALLFLNRHAEAERHLLKGLEIAEAYDIKSNIYQGNTFLHDLWEKLGNYERSLAYYKIALGAQQKISNDLNRNYTAYLTVRYNAERKNNQIELLAKEKEIENFKLRRQRAALIISTLSLALLSVVFLMIYHHKKISAEKKLLAIEQKLLSNQMNPHFLFNALNSIKHYIINNDEKSAIRYLNKFSKLVRRILEATSARETTLAEELETASLYMDIENIRLSHEIEFEIHIDKTIDPGRVRVPSILLQPFLENALWHGLSSRKGLKKITTDVRRINPDLIRIDITDNGVGRAASEKLKESRVVKRKSLGIDITKERLQNFARGYQHDFALNIEDLEENGKPVGTRVALQIPTS